MQKSVNRQRKPNHPAPKDSSTLPADTLFIHFKPRPILFRILLITFFLWMAGLIALYFLTVRNHHS